MPAFNGDDKRNSMGYSVGPFSFSGLRFLIQSLVMLITAMTIGSFSFVAQRGDSAGQILISSQSITVVALVGWAWFVRTGIKNSPIQDKLRLIDICLMALIAGHVVHLTTQFFAGQ